MKTLSESEMLHRAAAYCSASEHCVQDVEKKLKASGLPEEVCNRILTRLLEERFIDERRFARYFVSDKLRFNKWGRVKINYELQKRGIAAEIRSEAMDSIPEQLYEDTLLDLLRGKMKTTRARMNGSGYLKLLRFCRRARFRDAGECRCLKQLFKGNTYDEDME